MNAINQIMGYSQPQGLDHFPLLTPVIVQGQSGHISGHSIGARRYDVTLPSGQIICNIPESAISVDWTELGAGS